MSIKPTKISIIGAGLVGSTTAYTLMLSGLVSELVLVDINMAKAVGDAMDLLHGAPFIRPVKVSAGDYSDCAGSSIVILAAGVNQKPGESRLELAKKNMEVFQQIVPKTIQYCPESILLVVTNPVDILTYVTYKISGLTKEKVIGSGTVLDTARFKALLGEHVGVDVRNVHSYILGEHGDTEVATLSNISIAGMNLQTFCNTVDACDDNTIHEIIQDVRTAAYQIIQKKGATYYAVALAVRRIIEAILRDENSILTVSSLVEGLYGLQDVCLSLPTIVNASGISRVLELALDPEEEKALLVSARSLQQVLQEIGL